MRQPKAPRILWKSCGERHRDRVGLCAGYRIELSFSHNPRTPANERYEVRFAGAVMDRVGDLDAAKQYCLDHVQGWIIQQQEHDARQRAKDQVDQMAARDRGERVARAEAALRAHASKLARVQG
jgi:hypothetical protein